MAQDHNKPAPPVPPSSSEPQPGRIRNLMSRPQIFAYPTVHVKDGKRMSVTDTNTEGSEVLYPEWFYMAIPGEVFEVPPEQVARIQEEMKARPERLEDRSRRPIRAKQGRTPAVYHPKWEWTADDVLTPKMIVEQAEKEAAETGNAYSNAYQG